MTRKPAKLIFLALAVFIPATTILAYVSPHNPNKIINSPPLHERVLRTQAKEDINISFDKSSIFPASVKIYRDNLNGTVRTISGSFPDYVLSVDDSKETYIEKSLQFINEHHSIFGVSTQDLKVVEDALYLSKNEQFIKFSVIRNGILIEDAGIDLRYKKGHLVQIVNESFSEAESSGEKISSDLEEKVKKASQSSSLQRGDFLYRVVANEETKNYELIKVLSYQVHSTSGEDISAQIETVTGKIFELKDLHYHYNLKASADAHPRWFNQDLETTALPYIEVKTANGNKKSDYSGNVLDAGLTAPSIQGLKGSFVKISPVSGGEISQTAVLENDEWVIDLKKPGSTQAWLDKYIAQIMVYYHTNAIIERAKEFSSHPWLNQTLKANVNLTRTCNAHWDGNTINLYSGDSQCANTGTIADVIYHEWGHGLDAKTGGIADGAYSEGFGDIMSLVMTRSNLLGIGFRLPNHGPVRDLESDKVYPDDRGEVHAEGLIIGSTFWDLFKELTKKYGEDEATEIIANYAFKMIFTAAKYTQVYDALLVIDDDDTDLSNGSPNSCLLNAVFFKHGLAREEKSCGLATIDNMNIDDTDGDGYLEPSEEINIKVFARNAANQTIDALSGTLSLVEGQGVNITKSDLKWEPIPAHEVAASYLDAQIKVDDNAQCGSSFKTKLLLKSDTREVIIERKFDIGRSVGTPQTFLGTGLPAPIKDLKTTISEATIEGENWDEETIVSKAHLKFELTHSYRGDLTVKLIAPDGSEISVYKGQGSGDDVSFDHDITDLVKSKKGLGIWKLSVYDKARRDQGQLNSFELNLTPHKFLCD